MSSEELRAQVDAYIDEVWEDVVEDIRSLVQIESVEDLEAAEPGKPWGPKSYEALVRGLEICEKMGLEPHNCEGYIGYADLPGESDTQIATIGHTDIVPVGIGWTVPALDVTRREGYLMGRGVQDDKGPFVLSCYAMKFFADQVRRTGEKLPYTLRNIVGNAEETTMGDLKWYLEHFDAPAFCFTPDADFPLICGEKGILHGVFRSEPGRVGEGQSLVWIDGGTVSNAIPGLAKARVSQELADKALGGCAEGIESEAVGGGLVEVTSHGIGGHAAFPEGTDNAIGKLVRLLLAKGGVGADDPARPFLELVEQLTRTSDGSAIGIEAADEVFGPLTLNAGVIRTAGDGSLSITVDVRYPLCITAEKLFGRFEELAREAGCVFERNENKVPFYMDPELPEIKVLLDTYNEYMGCDKKAEVIGGGTYARNFPRACAFGPNEPDEVRPDWAGIEHGPDEAISEQTLKNALKIYIVSIARLMELDLG